MVALAGAKTIHTSHEKITGAKATVDAGYHVAAGLYKEIYTLVRSKGVWLITGSKQAP